MIMESRHRRFLSEMNVIPLVDVVLVLLIIFMVTAPMLHRGLDIHLPSSASNTIKAQERLIITIQQDQKLFLGNDALSLASLRSQLKKAQTANPFVSVYLRADQSIPYGTVVQVMDEVKKAKIENLGMVTGPKTEQIEEEKILQTHEPLSKQ